MKYILCILYLTGCVVWLHAQDSIRFRIIFIGDAGEINGQQIKAIEQAAARVIAGKTVAIYLGDNIYPKGMELPGSNAIKKSRDILRSQYGPMRDKGAPVYFIPGNHDWDKSGSKGFAKIKYQGQFLSEQGDSLLQLVPANGCPDPVEIKLTPLLTVIAYDSEWWLYPFNKLDIDGRCECKTKGDVVAKLQELRYKNRNRVILLASHHPFKTYGVHGGKFSWKDHLFPLANINKKLYIPLPVIGSLYPILRSTFSNPEDVKHSLYKDMIKRVSGAFEGFPNIAYVAGHEHGLQLIKDKRLQVVSGSGAKNTHVKDGKYSLFAEDKQGFVVADLLTNNNLLFNFYIIDSAIPVFSYRMVYTEVNKERDPAAKIITTDSVAVTVRPAYDRKGKLHRFFFGENYRKEWAASTTLPVIRISETRGGLKPLQLGGGMQSKSLRLADSSGKEWVIRSVEKSPDALLPAGLQQTFIKDWLDDATSAQHPFSALVVPPIANAVNIPHAKPVIGVVSPDESLGIYSRSFNNLVVLMEEREPLGESDNTDKLKKNLQKDNDNSLDGRAFLRARMLDAFLGDWDRHEDQWRWYDIVKGKEKKYIGIPRDRDQVFHLTHGLFPAIASQPAILPTLRHFGKDYNKIHWLMFKTRFVNAYPSFQLSRNDWKNEATKFQAAVTDSVLQAALLRLPKTAYDLRKDELLQKLYSRREQLPLAMDRYYRFSQKIVDIRASDKNEYVQITDAPDGGLNLRIFKIDKEGMVKDELMNKNYDASLTKEIRLYLGSGKDSVVVDSKNSRIKLRLIGGNDPKMYNVLSSQNNIRLYDKLTGSRYQGDTSRLKKHLSNDSLNTVYNEVNLYNIFMSSLTAGLNLDDGFIFGAGFNYKKQEGFRKLPDASLHQFMAALSFSTRAFRIRYKGTWTKAFGNADFTLQALAQAPHNTINFFGRGNETVFNKSGDFLRYYRTRFSTYHVDPAIRWFGNKGAAFSLGPSLYYYRFEPDENTGRLITNPLAIGSYDSLSINKSKLHLGFIAQYINDRRNSKVLPQWGSYINIKLQAYKGMSGYARDYAQVIPELALYKSLNAKSSIVLAERLGGTIGIGRSAFYQSAFLGGHENLLGYRQYRFAGKHSFYNNLELRIKLADVAGYIVPGQFGITGFWDIGRVWENNDNSGKWHNGKGAGIYFAPASVLAFNLVMGHSVEGWLPYFTMGLRF